MPGRINLEISRFASTRSSHWLEADIKATYDQRLDWLCTDPFNDKSENIKFTNNSAYFLAHEIRNKTHLPSFGAVKNWLPDAMKSFGRDGAHEWGTNYNSWTASSILNLSEFAQDAQIKKLATMCLDYYFARKSGFNLGGLEASGAVRRQPHVRHPSHQVALFFPFGVFHKLVKQAEREKQRPSSCPLRVLNTKGEASLREPSPVALRVCEIRSIASARTRPARRARACTLDGYGYACM